MAKSKAGESDPTGRAFYMARIDQSRSAVEQDEASLILRLAAKTGASKGLLGHKKISDGNVPLLFGSKRKNPFSAKGVFP